jgi:Beta-propeller repeat
MTRHANLPFAAFTGLNRGFRLPALLVVLCSWLTNLPLLAQAPPTPATTVKPAEYVKWGEIPLSFEPNVGQEPPEVRYFARGSSYTLYLAGAEMVLSGHDQAPLRMRLLGANPAPRVVGESQQISTSNYLIGNDPSQWHTSVPNYGKARYVGVYPGIDLVYYGHDGTLEYDWIVAPSADPRRIRLRFDRAERLRVDKQGDLVIEMGKTEYRHRKPVIYQEIGSKRSEIAGTWRVRGKEARFRIGTYDRAQPLIIDPALYYSTYLGGSAADYAYAIAVDKVGNTYVTGGTGSANFPTAHPLQASLRGSVDVFVTKINASGSARLYSTFLGSGGVDEGRGIAVNSRGEAYVTGNAGFSDFPMKNPIQGTWGGSGDAFLTKLNASGSGLVYSTYLGGNGIDQGNGIALDPAGNAYVVGTTNSTNFPTVSPFQVGKGAQNDAFVAKINPAGSAWVYATYLGGNNEDQGNGIAVDASGNAYVTGYTASTNFPVQSAFRGFNTGVVDAFVTKLNPVGSALVYSTYLGGSALDYGTAIAVDSAGSAYVTGIVTSDDFPLANPIDATLGSHAVDDVFVTKFTPSGSGLVYSTYLGGGSADDAYAIALDRAGNAYVTGRTNSSDFPLVNPIQTTRFAFDMFVTEVNAAGSAIPFRPS